MLQKIYHYRKRKSREIRKNLKKKLPKTSANTELKQTIKKNYNFRLIPPNIKLLHFCIFNSNISK